MMIQYFLMLIVLLLCSGLAIDAGLLQWRQITLQNAADAAAVEGMYQHARGDSGWVAQGQAQATSNGITNGSNNAIVAMSSPPGAGSYSSDVMAVQAKVTQQGITNAFMSLVNGGQSTVAAIATAREIPTCIWIMNQNNGSSGSLNVASARISANCGIYQDARSGGNLQVDGFGVLGALRIRVVGPSSGNKSSGYVWPNPKFAAAIKMDPLAYVTAPTLVSCTYNNVSLTTATTLNPGTYCGGISVSSTTVTLNPGLYIIAGGMSVYNATLIGTSGVTLYFTKTSAASSYSSVSFNYSTVALKAPTSTVNGGIKGVVVFADRNWVTHGSQGFSFNFSPMTFDGYWYTLNTGFYSWSSSITYYSYNGLVIDNIYQFGSTSQWNHNNFTALGGVSPLHYEDGVLVE